MDTLTENSPKHAEYIADFREKLTYCKDVRNPFESQWHLNLSFIRGKQYVQWVNNGPNRYLIDPQESSYRVRLVANKCAPAVRTEHAKLNKERPRGFVKPNTSDDVDRIASKAGNDIYEALYGVNALGLHSRRIESTYWSVSLGNGYTKIFYDKNKIDFTGKKGSIVTQSLNAFSIYVPDVLTLNIQDQEYVIQVTNKSREWIKDTYNIEVNDSETKINSKFLNSVGARQSGANKTVDVFEIWIKPCGKYEKGLWAVWAGEKLLDITENFPYAHGQYPYAMYTSIPTGLFWRNSMLVDMIPLQKEYNKSLSQLLEIRNATSKPNLIVQKGSIDPTRVTNQPGQIIEYLPGTQAPVYQNPPHTPGYVSDLINRMQADMDDTSGQHETSRGNTPTGVVAAAAITYVQEQDDTKLAPAVTSVEEAEQTIGSQVLSLFAQFCDEDRMIKIIGDNNTFEVKAFKGASLKGNTDYTVEFGSATPMSKAGKQAFILELQNRKIIDNTTALKHLDLSSATDIFTDVQRDIRQAERENLKMIEDKEAKQLDINDFDNHMAHIEAHQNFQKTQQYEILPDIQKQNVMNHIKLHYAHVASMYGRADLIPKPITIQELDSSTGKLVTKPLLDNNGKPKIEPTNPALFGFLEQIKMHGPPPPMPPTLSALPSLQSNAQ